MSTSGTELRQKLDVAGDLRGIVRTMKAMAASSIVQYERAVRALGEYDKTVRLGLAVALRGLPWQPVALQYVPPERCALNAIVFGSDQGLVGQFNDVIAEFAISTMARLPGSVAVWAVGERVHARLAEAGLAMQGILRVPNDVSAIAPLVGHLQMQTESPGNHPGPGSLYVFHNRQSAAAGYEPAVQRLLPLDALWRDALIAFPWQGQSMPETLGDPEVLLRALVREYLFISLFQSCAESLASENASRLAAMQRAEKNINEIVDELTRRSNLLRQTTIDEELFDVVSGFEALS